MNTMIHIYCRPWYNQQGTLNGTDDRGRYLVRLFKTGEVVAVHACDCEIVCQPINFQPAACDV